MSAALRLFDLFVVYVFIGAVFTLALTYILGRLKRR
jgi:hypothetical protein